MKFCALFWMSQTNVLLLSGLPLAPTFQKIELFKQGYFRIMGWVQSKANLSFEFSLCQNLQHIFLAHFCKNTVHLNTVIFTHHIRCL